MHHVNFSKFQAIEKDAWKHVSVEWERNRTVDNLWNITHYYNNLDFVSWNHSSSAEVKRYQRYMIKSIVRGYAGNDDPDSYDPWSFEGGFLYSLTVITTIGKIIRCIYKIVKRTTERRCWCLRFLVVWRWIPVFAKSLQQLIRSLNVFSQYLNVGLKRRYLCSRSLFV